jgi:hypothetical protein
MIVTFREKDSLYNQLDWQKHSQFVLNPPTSKKLEVENVDPNTISFFTVPMERFNVRALRTN